MAGEIGGRGAGRFYGGGSALYVTFNHVHVYKIMMTFHKLTQTVVTCTPLA